MYEEISLCGSLFIEKNFTIIKDLLEIFGGNTKNDELDGN
jgi:hypothetical protein